jgi:aspartate aminotransferase-like enzyme
MIALSEKALSKALHVEAPGLYFSVRESKKFQDEKMPGFPWTPAISIMYALHTSLKKIEKVGIAAMHAHFHRLASGLRAALKALELDIFTQPDALSDVLTVIKAPANMHPSLIVGELRDRYGILIAGGQGQIADKVFRITTIGAIGERDLIATVGLLELTLRKLGVRSQVGPGVTAMLEAFAAQDPAPTL